MKKKTVYLKNEVIEFHIEHRSKRKIILSKVPLQMPCWPLEYGSGHQSDIISFYDYESPF